MELTSVACMMLAAAFWGCTNPFIKRGGGDLEDRSSSSDGWWVSRAMSQISYLFCRWQFFLPLCLNQFGSVFNIYALGPGGGELSVAIPVVTSMTFVFTAITSWILGEDNRQTTRTAIGIVLMVLGVSICLVSKSVESTVDVQSEQNS